MEMTTNTNLEMRVGGIEIQDFKISINNKNKLNLKNILLLSIEINLLSK